MDAWNLTFGAVNFTQAQISCNSLNYPGVVDSLTTDIGVSDYQNYETSRLEDARDFANYLSHIQDVAS